MNEDNFIEENKKALEKVGKKSQFADQKWVWQNSFVPFDFDLTNINKVKAISAIRKNSKDKTKLEQKRALESIVDEIKIINKLIRNFGPTSIKNADLKDVNIWLINLALQLDELDIKLSENWPD